MNSMSGYLLFALPPLAFGVVTLIVYRHFIGENPPHWMIYPAILAGFILEGILVLFGGLCWLLVRSVRDRIYERRAKSQKQ